MAECINILLEVQTPGDIRNIILDGVFNPSPVHTLTARESSLMWPLSNYFGHFLVMLYRQ